jgi:hypothetical protein
MVERTPITVHGCAEHPRYWEATTMALGPLPCEPVATVTFPRHAGPYTVHVAVTVRDRDTGEPRCFGFTLEVDDRCPVAGGLNATLRRAYDHEVDENIYRAGVRVFEPHPWPTAEPHPEPLATPLGADDSAQRGRGAI